MRFDIDIDKAVDSSEYDGICCRELIVVITEREDTRKICKERVDNEVNKVGCGSEELCKKIH